MRKLQGKKVFVQDDNVDKALRKLKKKVAESGLLMELQERQTYIKPSIRKKIAKSLAKRRWQKHIQSQKLPPRLF
jgi:small subunit ribosomal protein S21